ncbi:CDK5 regulatory subunit-associated protein 1 [Nymphon striatum]|nr:CDK5 regulatory subunit-associated protein 1 [Nymphon striatum]
MDIVRLGRYFTSCSRIYCSYFHIKHVRFLHTSEIGRAARSRRKVNNNVKDSKPIVEFRNTLESGPSLQYFVAKRKNRRDKTDIPPSIAVEDKTFCSPYLSPHQLSGHNRKVYFDVYGCQMNVSDTEIAWSILKKAGFERTNDILKADVVLIMTCAIRENAEKKIWAHLDFLRGLVKRKGTKSYNSKIKIGILGCMAERLKTKILEEEKCVDLVAGPDSYKDLPLMLAVVEEGNAAVNVMLSVDETYADIMPVRINPESPSAYVSIMRGCDNMCSYCIVPFTRGRERSRPISSILEEIQDIIRSKIFLKQIILLGQKPTKLADGFKTIYKSKFGGRRFVDLLDKVSEIVPHIRIRFTSPHPKDFPDEVLHLIRDRNNICNQLHMPAQSGNSDVLNAMVRGYTRESYLNLIYKTKSILPEVTISSDFICGFCGETEEAHQDTLSLIKEVKYNTLFIYPYSLREKTGAHRRLHDDVPEDVKNRRTYEADLVYREVARKLNREKIGQEQLILIEGKSKKSNDFLAGRNEGFIKVIVPDVEVPNSCKTNNCKLTVGDYVVVKIIDATSLVLKGIPLYTTSLLEYFVSKS